MILVNSVDAVLAVLIVLTGLEVSILAVGSGKMTEGSLSCRAVVALDLNSCMSSSHILSIVARQKHEWLTSGIE